MFFKCARAPLCTFCAIFFVWSNSWVLKRCLFPCQKLEFIYLLRNPSFISINLVKFECIKLEQMGVHIQMLSDNIIILWAGIKTNEQWPEFRIWAPKKILMDLVPASGFRLGFVRTSSLRLMIGWLRRHTMEESWRLMSSALWFFGRWVCVCNGDGMTNYTCTVKYLLTIYQAWWLLPPSHKNSIPRVDRLSHNKSISMPEIEKH